MEGKGKEKNNEKRPKHKTAAEWRGGMAYLGSRAGRAAPGRAAATGHGRGCREAAPSSALSGEQRLEWPQSAAPAASLSWVFFFFFFFFCVKNKKKGKQNCRWRRKSLFSAPK